MSGFRDVAIVISEKSTPVSPTNIGDLTVISRNGSLYTYNGTQEKELAYTSSVSSDSSFVSISGDMMTGTLEMSGAAIQLDVNHTPAHSEGTIFYDSEFKTLSYYNDNADITVNVGQESIVRIRNNTGSLISNGKVVCISGSSGSHPLIVLADNTSPTLSHSTLGVATHDISDNENGYVTTSGMVNGLNTNSFSNEGVTLWLGVNGNLTETEPTAPAHKVKIGYLVRKHPTQGRILVAIDTGTDLKDLHDVTIGDYDEGALLVAGMSGVWSPGANINDLATKTEVASISGDLQSQIDAITVPTSATFLTDYDNRYVNVNGDTMTGNLNITNIKASDINNGIAIKTFNNRTVIIAKDGTSPVFDDGTIIINADGGQIDTSILTENTEGIRVTSANDITDERVDIGVNLFANADVTIVNLAGNTDEIVTLDANGKLQASGATVSNIQSATFGVSIDGGDTSPISGSMGYFTVPSNGNIVGWSIFADVSGDCVVDVRKSDYASFPTTSSIAGSEKPSLSSAQKNQDNTLSTWTTSLTQGDVIEFFLESAITVKKINIIVRYIKG
jgi:hypothetical protein